MSFEQQEPIRYLKVLQDEKKLIEKIISKNKDQYGQILSFLEKLQRKQSQQDESFVELQATQLGMIKMKEHQEIIKNQFDINEQKIKNMDEELKELNNLCEREKRLLIQANDIQDQSLEDIQEEYRDMYKDREDNKKSILQQLNQKMMLSKNIIDKNKNAKLEQEKLLKFQKEKIIQAKEEKKDYKIFNEEKQRENQQLRDQFQKMKDLPHHLQRKNEYFIENLEALKKKQSESINHQQNLQKDLKKLENDFVTINNTFIVENKKKNKVKFQFFDKQEQHRQQEKLLQELKLQMEENSCKKTDVKNELKFLYKKFQEKTLLFQQLKNKIKNDQIAFKRTQNLINEIQNKIQELKNLKKTLKQDKKNLQFNTESANTEVLNIYVKQKLMLNDFFENDEQTKETSNLYQIIDSKIQMLQDEQEYQQKEEKRLKRLMKAELMTRDSLVKAMIKQKLDQNEIEEQIQLKSMVVESENKEYNNILESLQQSKNCYLVVKQERNAFAKLIEKSSQKKSDIKEQFKILERHLQLLQTTNKEKFQFLKNLEESTDKIKEELMSNQKKIKTLNDQKIEQVSEERRVFMFMRDDERQLKKEDQQNTFLRKQCELEHRKVERQKIQYLQVNKVLMEYYELYNFLESGQRKVKLQLNIIGKREQFYSNSIKNQQDLFDMRQKKTPQLIDFSQKIILSIQQRDLLSTEMEELIDKIENQKNTCKNDSQLESTHQLNLKLNLVLTNLKSKEDKYLANTLVIEELEKFVEVFRKEAERNRQENLQNGPQGNSLKFKYNEMLNKIKALLSELSIFQAMKLEKIAEKEYLEQMLFQIKENQEQNLPPFKDSEMKFLQKTKRDKEHKIYQEKTRQEIFQEKNLNDIEIKTMALKRPNAYINQIGLPQPYKENFKPLQPNKLPLIKFNVWPVVIVYWISYHKHFYMENTFKEYFSLTVFLHVGVVIGSFITQKMVVLFGIRFSVFITGVLLFIGTILMYYCGNLLFQVFVVTLLGSIYQMTNTLTNCYLVQKYKDGMDYLGFCLSGQNIGCVIWAYLINLIINPTNQGMDLKVFNGSERESFFYFEVAQNFKRFCWIYGLLVLFIYTVIAAVLDEPSKVNFVAALKAIFQKNEQALVQITRQSRRLSTQLDESILGTSENQMSYEQAQQNANKIIRDKQFIQFVLVISVTLGGIFYSMDNYKNYSFQLLQNDLLSSTAIAVAQFFGMLGQVLAPKIWSKFQLYQSFNIVFFSFTLTFLYYIIIAINNKIAMFSYISIIYFTCNIFFNFTYQFKFSGMHPKVGLYVAQYIDLSYFICFIIVVIFNYLFYYESNTALIIKMFFLISSIGTLWYWQQLKSFEKNLKEMSNQVETHKDEVNQFIKKIKQKLKILKSIDQSQK